MIQDEIMKLQTYKMFEGEDTVYVERDDVLKALEQQPCEDTISRDAVEKITWEEPSYDDALNVLTEVRDKVRALPSATPSIPDVENEFDIGYNCGYADAMFDISEENDSE